MSVKGLLLQTYLEANRRCRKSRFLSAASSEVSKHPYFIEDSQTGYPVTSANLPFATASVGTFFSLRTEADRAQREATFGLHTS